MDIMSKMKNKQKCFIYVNYECTFRTSVYQSTATSQDTFKMPLSGIVSPPGVKTRSRRSSIYQRGPAKVFSPPKTRSRRSSMYVPAKARAANDEIFSKVWATPVKQPEPIPETSADKKVEKKITKTPNRNVESQSKQKSVSPGMRNPVKSAAKRSLSPTKKVFKTPKSAAKTPKSAAVLAKAVKSSPELPTPNTSKMMQSKTPVRARQINKKLEKQQAAVITSTPTKSLEEMTGKSFYGTPGETPIPNKRTDEVFVFSALPAHSAKQSAGHSIRTPRTAGKRKAVHKSPKSVKKSPRITSICKTPAPKRSRDTDDESSPVTSKRTKIMENDKSSPQKRMAKSVKRKVEKVTGSDSQEKPLPLSPIQMTSVLESVQKEVATKKAEKRKALKSPSPHVSKQAKMEKDVDPQMEPTPRVIKQAKRTSPKKVAEIVDRNENNSVYHQSSPGEVSFLNETFSTDSRSSRCTIL